MRSAKLYIATSKAKIIADTIFWLQSANIFIIFWDFLMHYQIFFSPKVKRCAIITYKDDI